MHGNSNFESKSTNRKERNARPPRGNDAEPAKQQSQRGKQWTRENDKREQWQSFGVEF